MGAPLDDIDAGEAAREMERVVQGLDVAHLLVVGMSQVVTAMNVANEPHYPPLRTVLEHAQASAERVMAYLHRARA